MPFLETPSQITSLLTTFMRERGEVLQLNISTNFSASFRPWAQSDLDVDAPINPNKQTNKQIFVRESSPTNRHPQIYVREVLSAKLQRFKHALAYEGSQRF